MLFTSSLFPYFISLVASGVTVSATRGLSVNLSGPDAVNGVDNFKVTTTVINTGNETLTILNHPKSPLSQLPANIFKITGAKGTSPTFTGIEVKYIPALAIAKGGDDLTILGPGESIQTEHDLSESYDFSKSGEDIYSLEPHKLFYIVNSEQEAVPLYADVEVYAATLTGALASVRIQQELAGNDTSCSSDQTTKLNSAARYANQYATSALATMNSNPSTSSRYATWFGEYTSTRGDIVKNHFKNIASHDMTGFTFKCETKCSKDSTIAYINRGEPFGTVHICPAFWKLSVTGTDSQAGSIVHESSHFTANGGTEDHAYGLQACKNLAKNDPDTAVTNADNHEYFAEN